MEQNIGHWINEVKNSRRPGYALVLAGPQGCGKTLLSRALATTCKKALIDYHGAPAVTANAIVRYDSDYGLDYGSIRGRITSTSTGTLGVIVETHTAPDLDPSDPRFLVVELPRVCHPEQRNGSKILARFLAERVREWPGYATRAEASHTDGEGRYIVNFFDGSRFVQKMALDPGPTHSGLVSGDATTRAAFNDALVAPAPPIPAGPAPANFRCKPTPFLQPAMDRAMASAAKGIRDAIRANAGAQRFVMQAEGYDELAAVLQRAFNQSTSGKGKDRHVKQDGQAFEDQPICELQRLYGSGYAYGQAGKKMEEAQRLPRDQAVAELLGGIVYLAAAVLVIEEGDDV